MQSLIVQRTLSGKRIGIRGERSEQGNGYDRTLHKWEVKFLKKITVAMYDAEGYTARLAKYFTHHQCDILDVRLFTNEESLQKYFSAHSVDLLLVDEDMMDMLPNLSDKVYKQILLSDGQRVRESAAEKVLFKYQSAECILQEVLSMIADDDKIYVPTRKKQMGGTRFVGVYAPFGGAGVSTLALRLARSYDGAEKCLYVDMELFDGIGNELESKAGDSWRNVYQGGMSDLIFFLRQNKDKLGLKVESLVRHGEQVDYIAAVEDYRDLYQMTTENLHRFLRVLTEETQYSHIVFDIGFFSEMTMELLKCLDAFYMPQPQTDRQRKKQQSFESLLRREGELDVISEIQYVAVE